MEEEDEICKKWYSPFILLLFVLFVTVGCTNEQPDINAASKPQVKEEQKTEANFTAKTLVKIRKSLLLPSLRRERTQPSILAVQQRLPKNKVFSLPCQMPTTISQKWQRI